RGGQVPAHRPRVALHSRVPRHEGCRHGRHTTARRPITIRDLLTHRSGISYGFLDRGAVGNAYRSAGVPDGLSTYDGTLAEAIDKLAAQPLLSQPCAEWHYSLAFDVLGRVVEVASG